MQGKPPALLADRRLSLPGKGDGRLSGLEAEVSSTVRIVSITAFQSELPV